MKSMWAPLAAMIAMTTLLGGAAAGAEDAMEVRIAPNASESGYDITIGGEPFTSYRHGEPFLDKPVFFPVLSPAGTPVNRFFGTGTTRDGENTDHPHHQSMWFTYGDVNGVDYWNRQKGRRIEHRLGMIHGDMLHVTLDWIDPDGVKVLEEQKMVRFGGGDDVRWMDHEITLKANESEATFGDTKEGAFGLRVAASLRENDRTGHYLNAEGLETSRNVWGKPSAWVALAGEVKGEDGAEEVTIAIFSHPTSLNHPPYWHARDYGLFTVNPFGRRGYDKSAPERTLTLAPGETVRLHFRLAVYSGKVGKERLDADFANFSQ